MQINFNITGAERKALVKVISETTGARAVYKYMPTCAYEISCFTVTREGVLEFDDRADSEEVGAVLEALAAAGFDGVGETDGAPAENPRRPPLPPTRRVTLSPSDSGSSSPRKPTRARRCGTSSTFFSQGRSSSTRRSEHHSISTKGRPKRCGTTPAC